MNDGVPNTRVTNPSVDGELGVTFNNNDVRGPMGIASTTEAAYLSWSDSRASSQGGQEAEDAYFSRVRFAEPGPLGGAGGGSGAWWAGLGAAAALAVGGMALALAAHRRPRQAEADSA